MIDLLSLRDLEYVVALDAERSFTRAAAGIPMAQPALSSAILRIERRLGVSLFERTSRQVEPTAAGRILADRAREIIASIARAIDDARSATGDSPIDIHVTDPSLAVPRRLVAALRKALPNTGFHQITLADSVVGKELRTGRLTLAVHLGMPQITDPELESILLCQERVVAVMDSSHPAARRGVIRPDDLATYPLASIDDQLSYWNSHVAAMLAEHAVTPRWSSSSAFGTVAGTDLVSDERSILLALESIDDSLSNSHLVSVPFEPRWMINWYLTFRRGAGAAPAIGRIVDAARETFTPTP